MRTIRQSLPADCLLGGKVHPSIAERLERIKNLPVIGVANFIGVEQHSTGFDLVWQAGKGTPLSQIDTSALTQSQRFMILDQTTQIVLAMHAHGIVHGALNLENVLYGEDRKVAVSQISPLLYDNPENDTDALNAIAKWLGCETVEATTVEVNLVKVLQVRQRTIAVTILLIATLIFAALLWYSQGR